MELTSCKYNQMMEGKSSTVPTEEVVDENQDTLVDDMLMEKILQRRSWRMRNLQRSWQVDILNHNTF